jgi:hypothetical protein
LVLEVQILVDPDNPLANARNDRGAVSPDMQLDRIQLLLKRSPQQEASLQQLLHDMHTPGTAIFTNG